MARSSRVLRFLQSPVLAYALILLLQLKVVWRAWDLRDLTMGDTSGYYVRAFTWYQDWLVNIVWSPLYVAFYGTLMHVTHDVYAVTTLHRLIIVFLATAGVLAVLRRMLPHWIALLVAAWWAVLPINFDTRYEVHLFALLPVLAAWLVVLRQPRTPAGGQWCRSIALAILVLSTFLVRNEMVVAVGCFGLVCLAWELRDVAMRLRSSLTPGQSGARKFAGAEESDAAPPRIPGSLEYSEQRESYIASMVRSLLPTLFRYALPTLLVLLLVVGTYFRSFIRFGGYVLNGAPQADLRDEWHVKHTLNMAQVYAFGYQQRHPEWDKSPWLECGELSRQTFGRPDPTISDMLRHNRRATLQHFAWNLRLLPAGLQVLLFNSTSFRMNPDYAPVIVNPTAAVPLSLCYLAIVGAGIALIALRWRYWWNYWLRDRAWGWAALLAVAATALFIVPTQRPRPSYLFSFSVLLMTIAGMSVFAILHTLAGLFGLRAVPARTPRASVPAFAAVLGGIGLAAALLVLHISRHPRPHYFLHLSPLTVLLGAGTLAAACAFLLAVALAGLVAIRRGTPISGPLVPLGVTAIMAALIVWVPSYYVTQAADNTQDSQRHLLRTYLALRPYQSYIRRKDTVFLKGPYFLEVRDYLGMAEPEVMSYSVLAELKPDETLADFLDRKNVNLFFLDGESWWALESGRPGVVRDLIEHGNTAGWRLVGFADESPTTDSTARFLSRWLLFRKAAAAQGGGFDPKPAGLSAANGNSDFGGWTTDSGLGPEGGPFPAQHLPVIRWGYGPETKLTVSAAAPQRRYQLVFSGQCWIPDQKLTVKLDRQVAGEFSFLPPGTFCDHSLELDLSPGKHELLLEYSKWDRSTAVATLALAVKFRKLQILRE